MAYTKGSTVTDIVSRILFDLSDPDSARWSSDQVIKFMNEGIRELADEGVFVCRDLFPLTGGTATYTLFREMKRIKQVVLNGSELKGGLESDLDKTGDWRSGTGNPDKFIVVNFGDSSAIRLVPAPTSSGSALVAATTPTITQDQGGKIDGNGYTSFDESGTIVNFIEGDGVCPSALTASNVLQVSYSFYPLASTAFDSIPHRLEDALSSYAQYRCLALPNDASDSDTQRAAIHKQNWEAKKAKIVGLSDGTSYLPFNADSQKIRV